MNDKEIIKKIKEYLILDIENNNNEISYYCKNLLNWVNKWEKNNNDNKIINEKD
jgi:hypothetical protein